MVRFMSSLLLSLPRVEAIGVGGLRPALEDSKGAGRGEVEVE